MRFKEEPDVFDMSGWTRFTVCCCFALLSTALPLDGRQSIEADPHAAGAGRQPITVVDYDARLEPDLEAGSIAGSVTLTLDRPATAADSLSLDRGDLTIDKVETDGVAIPFEVAGQKLTMTPGVSRNGRTRGDARITISYHGSPRFGLMFFPQRHQIYTLFSTSQWMVAIDAPSARASFHLRLVVPKGWTVVGNGREVARRTLSATTELSEWREDRPVPTYTFGFSAGQFTTTTERHHGVTLHYAAGGFAEPELTRVFAESARMLDFFTQRSDVRYPGDRYSQLLVARTAGQEMTGFSILSDDYGRTILADPTNVSLLAHEFAHQWWGNLVTCRDWTHFWLNEGFATFMAAAYREQRFGREVYLKDIEEMRTRYERVRDAHHDRSLVFPDWNRPTADDRTLVYQKGAYVLHLLRELIGDRAFWAGIRRYTRLNAGRSVTTGDFQRAMEQASGRSLEAFFAEWVYLRQ